MKVNPDLWEPDVPKLLEIAVATKDATSDLVEIASEPREIPRQECPCPLLARCSVT